MNSEYNQQRRSGYYDPQPPPPHVRQTTTNKTTKKWLPSSGLIYEGTLGGNELEMKSKNLMGLRFAQKRLLK